MQLNDATEPYWSRPADELLSLLETTRNGLDTACLARRLELHGPNRLAVDPVHTRALKLFLERFRSPLVLILLFAAIIAAIVQDWLNALIVSSIVIITAVLGFVQEYRANTAVARLRQRVSVRSTVLRGGERASILAEEVLPGDIVLLTAGSLVPADGVLLEATDFHVSQALLTGETFAVEKRPGLSAASASLTEQGNCIFMGTSVRSGTAKALIVRTGAATHFGQIAASLALQQPETEFERGLRHFGILLVRVMLVIVLAVLALNIALQHPTLETLLFAVALAVGLSPELLPAILTITLARGARNMASHGVIVKRLSAIENLGSMDVLCTDKTGTITKGEARLDQAFDPAGESSADVLLQACLNSNLQSGLVNPLDEAVTAAGAKAGIEIGGYRKLDEAPYDFIRRRMSIAVARDSDGTAWLITKGALASVLDVCETAQIRETSVLLDASLKEQLQGRFAGWSEQGFRVLGVARKAVTPGRAFTRDDEHGLVFTGFLLFFDPPLEGVRDTLNRLRHLGVRLKIITGDNRFVARHVAGAVGINAKRIITGSELNGLKDEALWHLASRVNVFAEVDPNQKERIIIALQKAGHVVGYLGDGINDAPALLAADVGISVDAAVDVAKEAADFVLLEHDLEVLRQGIDEGRITFANTLKYIFITTSANFGNMVSMAIGSLFLPFLPLLAKQILLNNFLSDIPAMGISGDRVDRDWQSTPHRWDMKLIRNFMISFGLVSAAFDLLTFGVLWHLVGGVADAFRTGWFLESLLTELCVLFVIRTYKPFYRSRAAPYLVWSAAIVFLLGLALPYLPGAGAFSFVPLPAPVMLAILAITAGYVVVSEFTKRSFFARFGFRRNLKPGPTHTI